MSGQEYGKAGFKFIDLDGEKQIFELDEPLRKFRADSDGVFLAQALSGTVVNVITIGRGPHEVIADMARQDLSRLESLFGDFLHSTDLEYHHDLRDEDRKPLNLRYVCQEYSHSGAGRVGVRFRVA